MEILLHLNNPLKENKEEAEKIKRFVLESPGLDLQEDKNGALRVHQKIDGKYLVIESDNVEEILVRKDDEGQVFLQINFFGEKKILLTKNLVGFKPMGCVGLDVSKLPKVVTTPDLVSVVEAIEENINQTEDLENSRQRIDTLHQVFNSILHGGETIGFDLSSEREWIKRLISCKFKTSSV